MRQLLTSLKGAYWNLLDGGGQLGRADNAPLEPLESNGLRAACHMTWPQDADLLARWDDLSRAAPGGNAFVSPHWQRCVWELGYPSARPRCITVHHGQSLLAVLPLALKPDGALETLGAPVSDYLDPLMSGDAQEECWRIILSLLQKSWDRRIHSLCLHNVREAAPSRTLLPGLALRGGFAFEEQMVEHAPCLRLPGAWDDFLATLDAHERKETRRKMNKAETKGMAQLVRCAEEQEVPAAIETCLRLMEAAPGEKGEAVKKTLRPLLELAAPEMIRRGRLDLLTLIVDGGPAACLLQFPSPTGPMLYNCGFDAGKKEWSPGVVAVAMAIRQAIASGASEYDMLRGREPYKYKLGATDRALYKITLRKK